MTQTSTTVVRGCLTDGIGNWQTWWIGPIQTKSRDQKAYRAHTDGGNDDFTWLLHLANLLTPQEKGQIELQQGYRQAAKHQILTPHFLDEK